jgi:hypothetical protein
MGSDVRERHDLFRYDAFAAARVPPPNDPERFGIANLPPPTARMETSCLLIGSAGTATFSHPVQTLAVEKRPAGGRPKQDQTVMELAREHGPRAIEVLAELMNNPKATASARAMAADRILDRAYGKPPQLNTTPQQT